MSLTDFLRPGDHLLYRSSGGVVSWVISVKTWSEVVHCEVYLAPGETLAARGPQDGKGGVQRYPLRLDHLAYVLRPRKPLDLAAGLTWFTRVEGQGYDTVGLLKFFRITAGSQTKQFCSEFLTRFDRHCGFHPFSPCIDADAIAPGDFLKSDEFDQFKVTDDLEVVYVG